MIVRKLRSSGTAGPSHPFSLSEKTPANTPESQGKVNTESSRCESSLHKKPKVKSTFIFYKANSFLKNKEITKTTLRDSFISLHFFVLRK